MADSPPTSRIARTRRFGGLVAGQGLRWAGTQAANRLRSDEKADAATGERAAATARELVKQLGQMRGAAMKIGQVLSTVDFTAIPESEREEFKQTLATLRDDGVTILLVDQMAALALTVADRGYVLESGRIVRADAAEALAHDPALEAAYLGHAEAAQ